MRPAIGKSSRKKKIAGTPEFHGKDWDKRFRKGMGGQTKIGIRYGLANKFENQETGGV